MLSIPCSEDLPNSGIEPRSPALQADSLPSEPLEKPFKKYASNEFLKNEIKEHMEKTGPDQALWVL